MSLLDDEIAARLAQMGLDVAALMRSCSPGQPCPCTSPLAWQPSVDVYEIHDRVVIKLEVAGVDVAGVTLTVQENLVVIQGARRDELPEPRSGVSHMEIEYGPFEKRIWLPWKVKTKGIRYTYDRGFLVIVMQKAVRPMERTVMVRVRI